MTRFDKCLAFTLKQEGGYSNVTGDRGGSTYKGITQVVYNNFRQNQGQPQLSVSQATDIEINAIYRNEYWKPILGDALHEPLDLVVFDTAVNSGVRKASKILQSCLGIADDGVIGNNTLAALRDDIAADMLSKLVRTYLDIRKANYYIIVNNNPTQVKFLKGWLNRLDAIKEEIK